MSKLAWAGFLGAALLGVGCSSSSNSSSSGCSGATTCSNGAGAMETCYTLDSSGACKTLLYKVGATVFNCVSCDDQAYCANAALAACGVADASVPADANLPEGASVDGGG